MKRFKMAKNNLSSLLKTAKAPPSFFFTRYFDTKYADFPGSYIGMATAVSPSRPHPTSLTPLYSSMPHPHEGPGSSRSSEMHSPQAQPLTCPSPKSPTTARSAPHFGGGGLAALPKYPNLPIRARRAAVTFRQMLPPMSHSFTLPGFHGQFHPMHAVSSRHFPLAPSTAGPHSKPCHTLTPPIRKSHCQPPSTKKDLPPRTPTRAMQ